MKKRLLLALPLCFLAFVLFLFSPYSLKLAASIAERNLDQLSLSGVSGSIIGDIEIGRLAWIDTSAHVNVTDTRVRISLSCLLKVHLCVEDLHIDNVQLNINATPPTPEPSSRSVNTPISAPLPLLLSHFQVERAQMRLADGTKVGLNQLKTALTFSDKLVLEPLTVQSLTVVQNPDNSVPESPPLLDVIKGFSYRPFEPASFYIPVFADVKGISIQKIGIIDTEQRETQISSLYLAAEIHPETISLQRFSAQYRDYSVESSLKLTSAFDINGTAQFATSVPLHGFTGLNLNVNGTPSDLDVSANTQGKGRASVRLNVDLLRESLPLEGNITWADLAIPFDANMVSLNEGNLSIAGNLDRYRLQLFSDSVVPELGQSSITGTLDITPLGALIQELKIESSHVKGEIDARLDIADTLSWHADLNVRSLKTRKWTPELDAEFSGLVVANGTSNLMSDNWVNLELDLQGNWQAYQANVLGRLETKDFRRVGVDDLSISIDNATFNTAGHVSIDDSSDLAATWQVPDLSKIYTQLSGVTEGQMSFQGTITSPEVELSLVVESLRFDEFTVAQGQISANASSQDDLGINVTASLNSIGIGKELVQHVEANLFGNQSSHTLKFNANALDWNSEVGLTGQLDDVGWQGEVKKAYVQLPDINETLRADNFTLGFQTNDSKWTVSPHCWKAAAQQVCLERLNGAGQQLTYAVKAEKINPTYWLDALEVTPLPSILLSSDVSVHSEGSWSGQGLPVATLSLFAPGTQVDVRKTGRTFTFNEFQLNAQSNLEGLEATLDARSPELGKLRFSANLAGDLTHPDIQGHAYIEGIDLKYLASVDHNLDNLAGTLAADITFLKALDNLALDGSVNVIDGAISPAGVQVHFTDIQQSLIFAKNQAALNGRFKLGEGAATMDGAIHWKDALSGQLSVVGEALSFSDQQNITAAFSPNIALSLTPEQLAVTGDINIPRAQVIVETLPESAITPSNDTEIIQAESQEESPILPWVMDVNILVDGPRNKTVTVDAFGLTSAIAGELHITKESDATVATGQLSLLDGRYQAYGQNLIVRQGDLLFGGSLSQPQLAIEAIRDPLFTEDDVTAGLRVSGFAQSPTIAVFSDPSLPQSDALSYLLRGRGISAGGDSQDVLLTNALLSIGLNKGEGVVSSIGNAVGIKDLNLDTTGQGDSTQLALSGTVAPGVTLSYGVGVFNSVSEVTLRYQLIPKLYLEAISGLNNAVDLYYQFTLDNPSEDE